MRSQESFGPQKQLGGSNWSPTKVSSYPQSLDIQNLGDRSYRLQLPVLVSKSNV